MILFMETERMEFATLACAFETLGMAVVRLQITDADILLCKGSTKDTAALEAVVMTDSEQAVSLCNRFDRMTIAPLIVISPVADERQTIDLLKAGADDVVKHSVSFEELRARIARIKRRMFNQASNATSGKLDISLDGTQPLLDGKAFNLPRRELRILEHLAWRRGHRVTKEQLFNAVYGAFETGFSETVIESHMCRLRRRLRQEMAHDPISSVRHLGYQLDPESFRIASATEQVSAA
ncbi:MAG: winged helix-turn-helix domain-containing protein [Pseudomonadota bacterium]